METDKTFIEAVDAYITQADYLTDADLPQIVALRAMAMRFDAGDRTPALFNVFGVTYRSLRGQKPDGSGPVDEAEQFLNSL